MLTAAFLNTYLRDDMNAVVTGYSKITSLAARSFLVGTGTNQIGVHAPVAGKVVRLNAAGNALENIVAGSELIVASDAEVTQNPSGYTDILSLSGFSIAAVDGLDFIAAIRKTSGASSPGIYVEVKLNGTSITSTGQNTEAVNADENGSGLIRILIPPRGANYTRSCFISTYFYGPSSLARYKTDYQIAANIPTGAITSLAIGLSGLSTAITVGIRGALLRALKGA